MKNSIKEFTFLYDYVLIEALPEDTTDSLGLKKADQYDDKKELGVVIKTGEGRLMDNGQVVPLKIKPGDKVYFSKYGYTKYRENGKDFLIIREYDIVAYHGNDRT